MAGEGVRQPLQASILERIERGKADTHSLYNTLGRDGECLNKKSSGCKGSYSFCRILKMVSSESCSHNHRGILSGRVLIRD